MTLSLSPPARALRVVALAWITLCCVYVAGAATYYVAVDGEDVDARDGLSPAAAWASLAYACERVGPGDNVIEVGPGRYTVTRRALVRSGQDIRGAGSVRGRALVDTSSATVFVASRDWAMAGTPREYNRENYMIAASKDEDDLDARPRGISVRGIRFVSPVDGLADGAILFRLARDITLADLHIEDFAWAGIRLDLTDTFAVRDCHIENANRVEDRQFSGNIDTRYVKNGSFERIDFRNTVEGERQWGVGYKGSGHEGVLIADCDFTTGAGFDIEIPFENEYGVEIARCTFNSTLSLPKPVQQPDPMERGYPYTFWIHDCYSTMSYFVEGPRNHLLITDNVIEIDRLNGRVYTQFGGAIDGPVEISRNLVIGVDRSFLWKREGRLDTLRAHHNTVVFRDAEDRAGPMFESGGSEAERTDIANWDIRNNVFVAAPNQPRDIGANVGCAGCAPRLGTLSSNLFVGAGTDLTAAEAAVNFVDEDPGFVGGGPDVRGAYTPSPGSFLVDRGEDLGQIFSGSAPDLGAVEFEGALSNLDDRGAGAGPRFTLARNPVRTSVDLRAEAPLPRGAVVSLTDSRGRTVARTRLATAVADVSLAVGGLAPGFYVLHVYTGEAPAGAGVRVAVLR